MTIVGGLVPLPWRFTITLRHSLAHTADSMEDGRQLRLGVVSHYVHGKHQRSALLDTTVALIKERRQSPFDMPGAWKWAITPLAGNAEVLTKWF